LKINRLLEIVTILLNRETVTAKELADRFGVSSRTIYRDIDALSSAGVPVYTNKGNSGGISLLEDYTLNKAMLSKSESESLLLALKTMGATSYPEADAIIDKLGAIFKNNQTTNLPLIELKLRCGEKVFSRLYDTFDSECISKNDDDSYDLTVTLPEDEWVYSYILSLGGNAEVIGPEHIREIIKIRAKEIIEKY